MRQAASGAPDHLTENEALAFLDQGQDFYETARGRTAAHPLLHYYAMLNVGKATLRVRGYAGSLERAHHGLHDLSAGTASPDQVQLKALGPSSQNPRIFSELLAILGYTPPQGGTIYLASELMAQVVIGHRLWREATSEDERFLVVDDVAILHDDQAKNIWLRLYVDWPTMRRHGMRQKNLLTQSGLASRFELVRDRDTPNKLCLQQTSPIAYRHRPTDAMMELVNVVRPYLWRIVSAVPGTSYRRYYLYLAPPGTRRATQLEATWALLYFLGSVVRYRPHRFHEITNGPYGPFVNEFIAAQPEQLLYLFASEMCRREVARPAIV